MNMELIKSLKKIEANKELLNKIENFDYSAEDIYNICKEYGFAGSFEEFEKDYEELFSGYTEHIYNVCKENGFTGSFEEFEKDYEELLSGRINKMNEKELSSVSGGKMNKFFSRSTAALLSALTLSTTAMPKSNASNINNEKPSISSRLKNFANKHPFTSVAASLGAEFLGISATIILGGSAIRAISHVIKKPIGRTQYLENLKNGYANANTVEHFIKTDLGTPVCPFPKNAEEISNDLIAIYYSKRKINESTAQYIYKIYNEGNVGIQTISEGLILALKKSFEKLGFELSDYSNIAEIIDFIRTSEDIPENQRETKFNYFLNNFAKIGNSLFKVDKIKAFIKEGIDFSAVTKTTYKVCIAIGLNDEELEKKYHIDTKKLFEKFVKSGIVVNEIDKNGNAISSCPIDKYEKFSGIDKCRLDFIVKNPSYSHETFTFPEDKGWSREFKICNCEKFRINEALGLVCRHSEGEKHWTLRDVGDTIDFIESFNKNTKDMKEMLNILKEMKK